MVSKSGPKKPGSVSGPENKEKKSSKTNFFSPYLLAKVIIQYQHINYIEFKVERLKEKVNFIRSK